MSDRPKSARLVSFTTDHTLIARRVYMVSAIQANTLRVWDTGIANAESELLFDVGLPRDDALPVYVVNGSVTPAPPPAINGTAALTLGAVTLTATGTFVAGPLILEQFTDTDGTALTAHTIAPTNTPATSWTAWSGTWTIQSNAASCSATGQATCNAGVSDGTIQASCTTPAAGDYDLGLSFRTSGAGDYWNAVFYSLTGTKRTQIWEQTAGSGVERAGAAFTTGNSETHTVQAVLSGNSITVNYDGGNTLTYSSAVRNNVTNHGLGTYIPSGGPDVFDNFQVS